MPGSILITGASGFLGRCLLRDLLIDAPADRFHVLVRSDKAQGRIRSHLHGLDLSKAHFVRGDVTQAHFGVHTSQLLSLSREVDEVWHLAASTSFDSRKSDEIQATNLDGTRHLLGVLAGFDRLRMLFHVSTAYACGRSTELVPEQRFPRPASFRNLYEQSKYESEQLVFDSGLPFTILRPSIIIGHSQTGDTGGEHRMVYGYVMAMYLALLHRFGSAEAFADHWRDGQAKVDVDTRLMVAARTPKNMVTVDDVARVCLAVRRWHGLPARELRPEPLNAVGANSASHQHQRLRPGNVFNIVARRPLLLGGMIDSAQQALRVEGFRYEPCLMRQALSRRNAVERAAWRHTEALHDYLLPPEPQWEDERTRALDVERMEITPDLFRFMIRRFVEKEVMKA